MWNLFDVSPPKMDFFVLAKVFRELENVAGRLEMTDIISRFLGDVPADSLPIVLLFLRGKVFPGWSGKDLGVGSKLMIKAIADIAGISQQDVEDKLRVKGDMGLVAEEVLIRKTQTTLFVEKLTLDKVYSNLDKLAGLTGMRSQEKKIGYIKELLSFAEPMESRYIVRLILQELRLGVGDGIVKDAISQAFKADSKLVDRAYALTSDLGEVTRIAKSEGNTGLGKVDITCGRPIEVMLAKKVGGIEEALDKFSPAAFEIKYDGVRLQIHKTDEGVLLFTRRLENVTKQFPEIVKSAKENLREDDVVVEGELVAIKSKEDRRPRPFQDLSRRIKRKYHIREMADKIPVEINLFDIVYYRGHNIIDEKFTDRRKILESIVKESPNFRLAEHLLTDNPGEANRFYSLAIDGGHEGVIAKNLDAPYQPGSRVGYMYKIKPVMETLDLVIVGATWGEGRRAHWLGSFLLATLDPDTGELLTIGRMGTGFTDEQLKDMTKLLGDDVVRQEGTEVTLKPRIVVEVAYEEIQKSPTYTSGYALRFPRLVRIRQDKGVGDAETIARVKEIFKA